MTTKDNEESVEVGVSPISDDDEMMEVNRAASDNNSAEADVEEAEGVVIVSTKAWSEVAKSFLYVEVSSVVLIFACIGIWTRGDPYLAYALSVAIISLLACIAMQIGEFVKPSFLETTEKPVSLFLFLWWFLGTGVITFRAPFVTAGNGYFSAWAGLLFTTHWALKVDITKLSGQDMDKVRKTLIIFGVCATFVLFACIPYFKTYTGHAAWGFSVAVVTIISCGVLQRMHEDVNPKMLKFFAIIMFGIWAVEACLLTFDGPFLAAGKLQTVCVCN
jgi:hypothetical protein